MHSTHVVTGATGFVGSALVLELLRESSSRVVCIARAHAGQSASSRVRHALERAARASAESGLLDQARARLHVIEGDLRRDFAGGFESLVAAQPEFWHVAASLRYEDDLAEEIHANNVRGTCRVLELANSLDAAAFNYMSTAYVAGTQQGTIFEALRPESSTVNNAYERSKILAEHHVAACGRRFRIFRPSIVIGFSKTGSAAGSDSGFYGYVHRLLRLRRVLERRGLASAFSETYLPGDPQGPLDMIPVDAVARNAVAISRSQSRAGIFHLTNAAPPELGTVSAMVSERLGLGGPRFRFDEVPSGPHATRLAEQMRFFLAYLAGGKTFDRTNTDAAIGAEASLWPLDVEGTRRYLDRFLDEVEGR